MTIQLQGRVIKTTDPESIDKTLANQLFWMTMKSGGKLLDSNKLFQKRYEIIKRKS